MVPVDDPVYQLNLVLHFLMKAPPEAVPIRPFLWELGFALDSVDRSLPLPPAVQMVAASLDVTNQPSPDVLASREANAYLIIECKGSSFGPESGTAGQARGLILAAADLRGPLAMATDRPPPYGCVAYVLPEGDAERMRQTLLRVREQLQDLGLAVSPVCSLGLEVGEDGLYVTCHGSHELPEDTGRKLAVRLRVQRAPLTRPFYLLPWLPSVQQRPEEKQYCLRRFLAAVWQAALSIVGQARLECWPADFVLSLDEVLVKATHGLWERWRSRNDVTSVRRRTREFLSRAFRKERDLPPFEWAADGNSITFRLSSAEELVAVRTCLETASPAEQAEHEGQDRQLQFPFN
ncbi:MAG: hypothetical protein H5U04_05400 [Firmicutes bacterium]|nr:hypothetical protein [Bacillota bacterium]